MEEVMSYLDDYRQAMSDDAYVQLGRMLADAQDDAPKLFVVTWFTMSVSTSKIQMKRHQRVCVSVEPHEQGLGEEAVRLAPKLLLECGQCRERWMGSPFPQVRPTGGSHDCMIVAMRPYCKRLRPDDEDEENGGDGGNTGGVNVDTMFGVET